MLTTYRVWSASITGNLYAFYGEPENLKNNEAANQKLYVENENC